MRPAPETIGAWLFSAEKLTLEEQERRFIAASHEAGASEDEMDFDATLKRIALEVIQGVQRSSVPRAPAQVFDDIKQRIEPPGTRRPGVR